MIGTVDEFGRALITLAVRADQDADPIEIQAWIDTAFNGELVMPSRVIEAAKLEQTAGIDARLADGKAVMRFASRSARCTKQSHCVVRLRWLLHTVGC